MNLIPSAGFRTMYSWAEVSTFLGMTKNQVHNLVEKGHLRKAGKGLWPFAQTDVNAFLNRLNNGKIEVGNRRA